MAQRRRGSYPPEFRAEAVRLARTTTTPLTTIARDVGVSAWTLRAWMKRADSPGSPTLPESERLELLRHPRENSELRQVRVILKKTTAFFAKESE